jgi:hypothetical protein
MPNYCDNSLTMTAITNKAKKLLKGYEKFCYKDVHDTMDGYYKLKQEAITPELFFNHFFPRPDMEDKEIRDWNCDNWGTKWDAGSQGEVTFDYEGANPMLISDFQTAWSPPIAFYENMKEIGFSIEATFNECGMGFCGMWDNDSGEVVLDYDEIELSPVARQVCSAYHDNSDVNPIELEPDAKKGDLLKKEDGSLWGLLLDIEKRVTHTELFKDAMESQGAFIELNWWWRDAIEGGNFETSKGREPFYQTITYLASGETCPDDAVIINNKTAVII